MHGRPVLGVVFGLAFGVFLALVLQQGGVYPLTTLSVIGLPILGLLVGLLLAAWGPIGRKEPGSRAVPTSGPSGATNLPDRSAEPDSDPLGDPFGSPPGGPPSGGS